MKTFKTFIILTLGILAGTGILINHAFAQNEGLSTTSKAPLEITADGTLEWHRNDKLLVATQNAIAKQGDDSVSGAKLTAKYREGQNGGGMQIWQVTADENVVLKSRDSTVYGQHAVYNLDEGLATMTGNNLKMVSPDQTVTARDQFEYHVTDGRVNALGDAKVVRPKPNGAGQDTLQADKISAVLKKDQGGQNKLETLEAFDNVIIVTPTETVTGNYGIYRASNNIAEIKGNVKIKRGPNTLEGERAEVNLNTNVSRIFGGGGSNLTGPSRGRVRGVFYPGSQ